MLVVGPRCFRASALLDTQTAQLGKHADQDAGQVPGVVQRGSERLQCRIRLRNDEAGAVAAAIRGVKRVPRDGVAQIREAGRYISEQYRCVRKCRRDEKGAATRCREKAEQENLNWGGGVAYGGPRHLSCTPKSHDHGGDTPSLHVPVPSGPRPGSTLHQWSPCTDGERPL
jgi:hypothetical protein